jgi:hypothetical protein
MVLNSIIQNIILFRTFVEDVVLLVHGYKHFFNTSSVFFLLLSSVVQI